MSENPSTPSKGRRSDDVAAHHVSPATQPPTPQLPSTLYETRERNIAENDAFIAALFGYSPVSYNTTPSSAKKRRRGNFENEHNAYHSRAGSVSKVPRLSLGRAAKGLLNFLLLPLFLPATLKFSEVGFIAQIP